MTLIESYLRAVAAQLPQGSRDDIIAELREALESRLEDRRETLGRALTEAEIEAALHDMGHPLAVAARYGAGPQHVVGPELYPWWLFGVKVAVVVLAVITGVGALARVLFGQVELGQAIGQGFSAFFSGSLTLIGLATLAAFIIERQKDRPAFLTRWRARDLGLYEISLFSGWDVAFKAGRPKSDDAAGIQPAAVEKTPPLSPAARALGSAAGWGVFLLWWTGLLGGGFGPADIGGNLERQGVDYAALFAETLSIVYVPVAVYAGARAAFHLLRAAFAAPVRLTAFGDVVFRTASLAFIAWLWTRSPFAPLVRVETVEAFIDRVRTLFETGRDLNTVLMLVLAVALVTEALGVLTALRRLATGR